MVAATIECIVTSVEPLQLLVLYGIAKPVDPKVCMTMYSVHPSLGLFNTEKK